MLARILEISNQTETVYCTRKVNQNKQTIKECQLMVSKRVFTVTWCNEHVSWKPFVKARQQSGQPKVYKDTSFWGVENPDA